VSNNFYHILEARSVASPEALQALYEEKRKRLEQEREDGNPNVKEQLWALKHAYETLANPAKRAVYDDSLKNKAAQATPTRTVQARPDILSWKMNALLIALLASGLVGLGLHFGKSSKKDDHTAQVLKINRTADNDATRAGTERVLVEGTVNNESKVIDRSAELGNRSLNIQQDAENRRRQELEYRANAGARILDMQQQQQSRQLAMQEERSKAAQRQSEERRVEREKRYWACMNAALDRVSAAAAGDRCAGYR